MNTYLGSHTCAKACLQIQLMQGMPSDLAPGGRTHLEVHPCAPIPLLQTCTHKPTNTLGETISLPPQQKQNQDTTEEPRRAV